MSEDPRRHIPRTDALLDLPEVSRAREYLGEPVVRDLIHQVQHRARSGQIAPDELPAAVRTELRELEPTTLQPVLNATGVVVHTNLGRAPLAAAARDAVVTASGYVDVELDLATGARGSRGHCARQALLSACPAADEALIVNNGAAALMLATTALAGTGEVVISRGELIEIGAGFRLPDLIAATGTQLVEVGTTNRTHARDYAGAITASTGCVLKVHPSNFRVQGFTSDVPIAELRDLAGDVPIVADLGSGLLHPDPSLPSEPDVSSALQAGADIVIVSGDKLLGGPQAGLVLGRAEIVARIARHPLARAVRADKLTLAALEATVRAGTSPVQQALHADPEQLRMRTQNLASELGAEVVAHAGRVGGGGAPGVKLPGWAVTLPQHAAARLRQGKPPVLARVHEGACLVDLRCIPAGEDARLTAAIRASLSDADEMP